MNQVQAAVEEMTAGDKSAGYGIQWEIFKLNVKRMAIERASAIKNEEQKKWKSYCAQTCRR